MDLSSMREWISAIVENFAFTEIKSLFIIAYDDDNLKTAAQGAAFAVALSGGNVAVMKSGKTDALNKVAYLGGEGVFRITESCGEICIDYCTRSPSGRLRSDKRFFSFAISKEIGLITPI